MGASVSIDSAHVVHETIDGEAILIHLGTGTYYSLDGTAAELWAALAAGADRDAVLAAALERYQGDAAEIERGVNGLIDTLLREGLLIESPGAPVAPPALPRGTAAFTTPQVQIYTDMQDFMLVDPLHEVDEAAGWPHAKSG